MKSAHFFLYTVWDHGSLFTLQCSSALLPTHTQKVPAWNNICFVVTENSAKVQNSIIKSPMAGRYDADIQTGNACQTSDSPKDKYWLAG